MGIFKWDDKYSVSINMIDTQHKKLFDIINNLFDAMSTGCDRPVLKKTLGELANYTKTHFRDEEEMLKKAGYPKLQWHHGIHVRLIGEINEFIVAYNKNDMQKLLKMPQFLRDWLCEHILKIDTQYIEHVVSTKQGVGV